MLLNMITSLVRNMQSTSLYAVFIHGCSKRMHNGEVVSVLQGN
jgi:hypothetical protein